MKNPRNNKLEAKVASEGYCCVNGYLRLCKARGESTPAMADWLGLHRFRVYHYLREMKKGNCKCMNRSDCLNSIIEEINQEKEK